MGKTRLSAFTMESELIRQMFLEWMLEIIVESHECWGLGVSRVG